MIMLNIYTIGKVALLLTSSIVVILCATIGKPINIKKQILFWNFIKRIAVAVFINFMGIIIYFLRGNFEYSSEYINYILYFVQYIVITCYTVSIMAAWLQVYYQFFRQKLWSYIIVSLWIINEAIHLIPSIMLFIMLTIGACLILKWQYNIQK